jgi:hypothetical protein
MRRINVTDSNLKTVWEQLDNACGEMENALNNIAMMKKLPTEIHNKAQSFDVSEIVSLKNSIEELREKKNEI